MVRLLITASLGIAAAALSGADADATRPTCTWEVTLRVRGDINAIDALTPRNLWAVGSEGTYGTPRPLVARWDGRSWRRTRLGVARYQYVLGDIDATGPNSGWVVGDRWRSVGPAVAIAARWNGRQWREVSLPAAHELNVSGVKAFAPNNVLLIGNRTTVDLARISRSYRPLVARWDGRSWTILPTPVARLGRYRTLDELAAFSPTDVWMFARVRDLHWDGTHWDVALRPRGARGRVFGADAHDRRAWVVGGDGMRSFAMRYTGRNWVIVKTPGTRFRAVDVTATTVWAVAMFNARPHLVRWTGRKWANFGALPFGATGATAITSVGRSQLIVAASNVGRDPESGAELHRQATILRANCTT